MTLVNNFAVNLSRLSVGSTIRRAGTGWVNRPSDEARRVVRSRRSRSCRIAAHRSGRTSASAGLPVPPVAQYCKGYSLALESAGRRTYEAPTSVADAGLGAGRERRLRLRPRVG